MSGQEGPLLYHETQESLMCGVHALNALLQGPYFNEVDLAQIALALDEEERQVMAQGGVDSPAYLRWMAEDSSNVADDGNYSVDTLRRALALYDLAAEPLQHPDNSIYREQPATSATGYLFNSSSHWFALRRIDDAWYDFNSFHPAPRPVSNFYLNLFIDSMEQEGYTVYVVLGDFPVREPVPGAPNWKHASAGGNTSSADPGGTDAEAAAVEQAIAASLSQQEDDLLQATIAASLEQGGQAPLPAAGHAGNPVSGMDVDMDEDEQMRIALALSMQDA